jgi:amino acid adenylation domain-containing protein
MPLEDSYPLSSMQQGMLFHSLYEQLCGVYIEQIICSLAENLNVAALLQSWQRVVERHSILRTSFSWEDSHHLQQSVYKQVKLPLEEQDWRRLSKSEQESRLQAYLQEDRQRGFDLAEPPLMRLALFQLAEADYKLVWTFHHALLDGRSILIILKEVFAVYEAFYQNQDLQLEKAHPYRDYIDWLEQQSLTKAEEFWRRQLRGFEAPIPLSLAKASGIEKKYYRTQKVRLSMACTSALAALAQEHQLTLNTLVQGAWALLLNRYSGKDDVVFGATRACRHSAFKSMESMVGLFINTLPVRVQVNPDRPLLPWLKELRSQWITLRDYEHTPLVKIQQWSEVPRGMPLFESLLVFENYELSAALVRQGGKWKHREFELLEQPNYPLTLAVYAESELLLKIDYDCRRFDDDAIARMLGHIETLLEGITAKPHQCLGELPLLTELERHQLLVQWNDTQVDYPKDVCIHQLFEAQVERIPDAVAVVFDNQRLTYRELNAQANQLARYLQALGVKPEVLVGICMERSLEMVVGLLGILKAGGAYVPLDPAYPKDRLAYILSDSQVPVLLTQEKLVNQLPENRTRVVCFDTDWGAIVQESAENPVSGVKGSNLAYVIYTSGSTGQPKGVTIEHCSVLNLARGLAQAIYTADEESQLRVSLNGPVAFDTSVKQVIQLLYGHTLEIVPEYLRFDGSALLSYLQRREIDVFDCTPSQLELLISEGLLDSKSAPEYVLVGGEPINESIWQRLITAKNIRFYNVYGPTECTVDTTVCTLRASEIKPVIGRPIANTQVYILNSQLQPVPIGVAGELHIGGAGLARGYLNRPDLTAEKFIPNRISDEPGARLYKTGDLARYLPDGNIEFIGRIDRQVKIRGLRIEQGEVETVLAQHPTVQQCVVTAREDRENDKRLVAYIISNPEQAPAVNELRRFLKQKLPEYMVPNAFVFLDALPLTPNGKLDRRALPAPDQTRPESEANFVVPRDDLELQLTLIWEKVLGIQPIGVMDNFFELGGHSLLVVALVAEIKKAFNKNLPLAAVFQAPTVSHLAKILRQEGWSASSSSLAVIQAGGRKPPLFFIHVLGEGLEYCRHLARHLDPEQPIYGLAVGIMDEVSQNLVENLDNHYIKEMRRIQPNGPYFLAGIMCGGRVAYNMAEQLHAQGQKVELLALLGTLRDENSIKILSVQDWVAAHWNNFSRLGHAYVLNKMKRNIENVLSRLTSIYCKFYERMGLPLPQDYQSFTYRKGKSEGKKFVFAPQVYPDRVTLFRAMEEIEFLEPDLGWSELAPGGLEIHDVPGNIFSMLKEPHVKVLAEQLKAGIDRVQGDDLARIPPQDII